MVDTESRPARRARCDVPEIAIINRTGGLTARPATIFEIQLTAGDAADAVLTLQTDREESPLIELRARAGGRTRYQPAAPAFVRESLQVQMSGEDAVGAISYR